MRQLMPLAVHKAGSGRRHARVSESRECTQVMSVGCSLFSALLFAPMPQYARLVRAVTTRRHRLPSHPGQAMSGSANRRIRFPVRSIGAFADKGAQLVVPEIRAEGRHARL